MDLGRREGEVNKYIDREFLKIKVKIEDIPKFF